MADLKKRTDKAQLCVGIISPVLAMLAVNYRSVILSLLTVLSLFVIVGIMPIFRKRENLWMFLLVAVTTIAPNLRTVCYCLADEAATDEAVIVRALWSVLIYCLLLSVEEIVMGIVTRLIWRKQYKIVL